VSIYVWSDGGYVIYVTHFIRWCELEPYKYTDTWPPLDPQVGNHFGIKLFFIKWGGGAFQGRPVSLPLKGPFGVVLRVFYYPEFFPSTLINYVAGATLFFFIPSSFPWRLDHSYSSMHVLIFMLTTNRITYLAVLLTLCIGAESQGSLVDVHTVLLWDPFLLYGTLLHVTKGNGLFFTPWRLSEHFMVERYWRGEQLPSLLWRWCTSLCKVWNIIPFFKHLSWGDNIYYEWITSR
jgi:hypothetical protein